jgi:hypothetical protein
MVNQPQSGYTSTSPLCFQGGLEHELIFTFTLPVRIIAPVR